jgi:hypothetical protein
MIPKRKLIKKRHRKPESTEEVAQVPPTNILDKIRSGDTNQIEEALAFVSSMCTFEDTADEIALLAELVTLLKRGPNSVIYLALYGLANLI